VPAAVLLSASRTAHKVSTSMLYITEQAFELVLDGLEQTGLPIDGDDVAE
jgi:hypothetical protein